MASPRAGAAQPPWVCTSIYHENGGWYSRPAKREIFACATVAAGGEHYLATCGRNRTTVYAVTADSELEEDGLVLLRCYVDDDPKEDYWTVAASVDDETGDVWVAVAGERQLIKIINVTAGGGDEAGSGGGASPSLLSVNDDTSDDEADVAGCTGGEGACLDGAPECFWYLQGHGRGVNELAWHPTQRHLLVSASLDETLRLWNARTRVQIAVFSGIYGHKQSVLAAAFHPAGHCFASGSIDNTVKVWRVDSPEVKAAIALSETFDIYDHSKPFPTVMVTRPAFSTLSVHSNYVDTVAFLGNGTLLTKCCGNQAFQMMWWGIMMSRESFIKTPTGDGHGDVLPLAELVVPDCQQWFVRHAVSPNRRYVALGTDHGGVYVYDLHMLADAAARAEAIRSSGSSSAAGAAGAAAGADVSSSSPVSSAVASPTSSSLKFADDGSTSSSSAAAAVALSSPLAIGGAPAGASSLGVLDEARAVVSIATGAAAEPDEARVAAVAAQLASIVDGNALIPTDVRVTLSDSEKAAIVTKALAVAASAAADTTPRPTRGRGRGGRGKAASSRPSHSSAASSAAASGGAASSPAASSASASSAAAASGASCAAASASGFDTAAHLDSTLRAAVAGGVGLLAESPSVPKLYPFTTLIHYNSTQQVRQVAFTSDSRTIIAVCGDGLVLRWDVDDGSRRIRKYVPPFNWTADKPGGTRGTYSKSSGVSSSTGAAAAGTGAAAGEASGGAAAAAAPPAAMFASDDVYIKPDPGGMAAETEIALPVPAAPLPLPSVSAAAPVPAVADAAPPPIADAADAPVSLPAGSS